MTNFKRTLWALGFLCLGVSQSLGMDNENAEGKFYLYRDKLVKLFSPPQGLSYLSEKKREEEATFVVTAKDVIEGFPSEYIEALRQLSRTKCNVMVLCENKDQSMKAQEKRIVFSKGFNFFSEAQFLDFVFPKNAKVGDQNLNNNKGPVSIMLNEGTQEGFKGLFSVLLKNGIQAENFRLLSTTEQSGLFWSLQQGLEDAVVSGRKTNANEGIGPKKSEEKKPEERKEEYVPLTKTVTSSGGTMSENVSNMKPNDKIVSRPKTNANEGIGSKKSEERKPEERKKEEYAPSKKTVTSSMKPNDKVVPGPETNANEGIGSKKSEEKKPEEPLEFKAIFQGGMKFLEKGQSLFDFLSNQ